MNAKEVGLAPSAEVRAAVAAGREVPVLDVGAYLAGDAAALEQLAADLRFVQENVGFYCIVNHGVGSDLIRKTHEQVRALFGLSEEEKARDRAVHHHQGWWPSRSIVLRWNEMEQERKTASVEGWIFFRERGPDDPQVIANVRHRTLNKWPDERTLNAFRPTLLAYIEALEKLGLALVQAYARALGLPKDYFAPYFTKPEYYLRCNHYPPTDGSAADMGLGAHSDHSFLTLLPMSDVPGLELLTPQGTWLPVQYCADAIIVNTGEFLNRWTNGRFIATPHRVLSPAVERVTVPFFLNPNDDAIADPLPTCVTPERPRSYDPLSFYAFFEMFLAGNYTNRGDVATEAANG